MSKYPINKEYSPFSRIIPPLQNDRVAGLVNSVMKTPRWIWHDPEVAVTKRAVTSYDGADIEVLFFEPYGLEGTSPCLVYYHGGGFTLAASAAHYRVIKQCALEAECKVVFVQYRLAPENPHPTPSEDCYAVLRWTFENAEMLNIDRSKIAVGGDSAGGALAAAVCQMARDRGTDMPLFQLLIYPVTDRRMQTDSCRKFTDTPMWNAKLNAKMWRDYLQDENASSIAYASPMEAQSFENLPDAYVETAEFDCLHDEGIAYAEALRKAGAAVEINETKGTMHGFDIVRNAPTTKKTVAKRIEYIRSRFNTKG